MQFLKNIMNTYNPSIYGMITLFLSIGGPHIPYCGAGAEL